MLGVPYAAEWGHRGAAHSIGLAIVLGAVIGLVVRSRRIGILAIVALASHGLLDALTDGGLGVALYWPFDLTRHFFAWRPIPVAPIGAGFLSWRGLRCALFELWRSPRRGWPRFGRSGPGRLDFAAAAWELLAA